MVAKQPVDIIGVPLDLGGSRRGTDMGPSAIRYARLQDRIRPLVPVLCDRGNIDVPVPETRAAGDGVHFVEEIAQVCEKLAGEVAQSLRQGHLPLVLGGDHSLAIGTLAGHRLVGSRVGIIWIDAHGDFNTPETSPSGNVHGMPLIHILGRGHPRLLAVADGPAAEPGEVVLLGVRNLDPGEKVLLKEMGIHVMTMREVDEKGMAQCMREALAIASRGGTQGIHLSFDMDAMDPTIAPGVGTPVPGGLTYREAHVALEILAETGLVRSMEFVEVNPILDQRNQTAEMAVELIQSALGKRIL
ncbi:MAG: arginase [Clostridiales bacterium]|nr:arginase [Clostridiales bacterium]